MQHACPKPPHTDLDPAGGPVECRIANCDAIRTAHNASNAFHGLFDTMDHALNHVTAQKNRQYVPPITALRFVCGSVYLLYISLHSANRTEQAL